MQFAGGSGRTIFLLAGYPAAGKSTLLRSSQREGVPLFGTVHDSAYRGAIRVDRFDERQPSLDKIRDGMWLTLKDFHVLKGESALPDEVVLHLDLVLLAIAFLRPRSAADFNRAALRRSFKLFFEDDLFAKYPTIVVNTLKPSLDVIARNWSSRQRTTDFAARRIMALKNEVITQAPNREAIYDWIYGEWLAAVGARADHSIGSSLAPRYALPAAHALESQLTV